MNSISTYIYIGVLAVVIGYLWYTGQLMRLANYVRETNVELKKCTWPTWNELKGSTLVVTISILLLGTFTFVVDRVFQFVVLYI